MKYKIDIPNNCKFWQFTYLTEEEIAENETFEQIKSLCQMKGEMCGLSLLDKWLNSKAGQEIK